MNLGVKMEKQYINNFAENQPQFTRSFSLSKDRKWLTIKTIRTDILHVNYMKKVLGDIE